MLEDACKKQGKTVVIITHNAALTSMADRVVRMKNGTVISVEENKERTSIEEIEW